jgi:hypothetical protein
MRDDLVTKLHNHLTQRVNKECQVVYILCQVRKLLDGYCDDKSLLSLKFYCDWAVHTNLTYDNRTKPFLQIIDNYIHKDQSGTAISLEEQLEFQALLHLDSFRWQLKSVLESYTLPTDVCRSRYRWLSFVKAYSGVIQDGSLVYKGRDMKVIKSLTFISITQSVGDSQPATVEWKAELKNGNTFTFSMTRFKNKRQMSQFDETHNS